MNITTKRPLPTFDHIDIMRQEDGYMIVRVVDSDRSNLIHPDLIRVVMRHLTEVCGHPVRAYDLMSAVYPLDENMQPISTPGVLPKAFAVDLKFFS